MKYYKYKRIKDYWNACIFYCNIIIRILIIKGLVFKIYNYEIFNSEELK